MPKVVRVLVFVLVCVGCLGPLMAYADPDGEDFGGYTVHDEQEVSASVDDGVVWVEAEVGSEGVVVSQVGGVVAEDADAEVVSRCLVVVASDSWSVPANQLAGVKCSLWGGVWFNSGGEPVSSDGVAGVGRQAALMMVLPDPVIGLSPDPSVNQWNAWAVNAPVWLVVDMAVVRDSVSRDGLVIELSAVPVVSFDMGDGGSVRCTRTSERPAKADVFLPSPTCGYTYARPGVYTITATAEWQVTWSAAGQSGTLTTQTSSTRELDVIELIARRTG